MKIVSNGVFFCFWKSNEGMEKEGFEVEKLIRVGRPPGN